MKWLRKLFNPLLAFIGIQLAWVLVVVVWFNGFIGSHRKLREIAAKYRPDLLTGGPDWLILAEGLVLLVAILVGVYVIFVYWSRQSALVREQRQFISQVTHELKSPLASLQLHLETLRRHQLPLEKQQVFLETMLADTSRLNGLIDNLLSASRIDQKHWQLNLQPIDFSEFISHYFRIRQYNLPRAGRLDLEIEPNLHVAIDRDAFETILRNLLENAVLYSDQSPELRVNLKRLDNSCLLSFADRGRGIDQNDQKNIFKMFYRVRRKNENIRGSGLGLYIIKTTVRKHKGTISVESAGQDQGTTFHIELPLCPTPEKRLS